MGDWMIAGEQGLSQAHIAFRTSVLQAEAEHEASLVEGWEETHGKMLAGEIKNDWRSFQSLLAYRHKWAPPAVESKVSVTQDVTVSIQPDLSRLNLAELAELRKLLVKTTPQIDDGSVLEGEFELIES